MKILVTGAKGMLGQDLVDILCQQGFEVIPTDADTLDITNESAVSELFDRNKFDIVVHTAAYTDVDGAETNKDLAFMINYRGTENIARYAARQDIPIAYISTDYVFNGENNSPYKPYDQPDPINIYGLSKLMGEQAIQKYNPRHYIVRTSWLYGHNGRNFVKTVIDLAHNKPELRIVSDQTGCPTWTVELSKGIIRLIKANEQYGIYHICGSGSTSWHGFASKIVELSGFDSKVIPVLTKEFPRPAKRPKYSVLDNNNSCPDWSISLKEYLGMGEKYESFNFIGR